VRTLVKKPSGQVVETWAPSLDPDLNLIRCRRTPLILVRPTGGEVLSFVTVVDVNEQMIALQGYYPQIRTIDKFKTDNVEYDIKTVEHDGNKSYTRLRVEVRK
jgi:hypothetical protein